MPGLSPQLPLNIGPIDGYNLNTNFRQVAQQNLKMIIMTNPGERIMDIGFGVGIKRFLFRQNAVQTHDVLINRVSEQVTKYLPYIKIIDLDVDSILSNSALPENFIRLRLEYKIRPYNERDVLELSISA